jgi:hypothetical protein
MNVDPFKRELQYRKAHGNSLREKYKQKLKCLLGADPEEKLFLSLAETDKTVTKLVKSGNIFSEDAEFSALAECLKYFLSKAVGGDYYLLMDEDWRYCGAYIVRNFSLDMEFDFNKHQSDEVRLINTDLSAEMTIDYTAGYNEDLFDFRVGKYALA